MKIVIHTRKRSLGVGENDSLISSIDYDEDSKKMVSFCVLYMSAYNGKTYEIIKFDAAHMVCHVHKYYENLSDPGQRLLDNPINRASIVEFRNDIKQNWVAYKRKYFWKWFKRRV